MNTASKKCHNITDGRNCNHCGIGCTDNECDKSTCEIIKDAQGQKHQTCMCPKTSCICLGREPTKTEYMNHLVNIYSNML